jgi:hypothetical protein
LNIVARAVARHLSRMKAYGCATVAAIIGIPSLLVVAAHNATINTQKHNAGIAGGTLRTTSGTQRSTNDFFINFLF